MNDGITNTVASYFKRTIPHFEDLFTTNFKITSYNIDSITNIATIQTSQPHQLNINSCIVVDSVKYGYSIDSIKTTEYKINNEILDCIEITIDARLIFYSTSEIDIKNITTNPLLNSKFICYRSTIIDNKTKIVGLYKNKSINIENINIVNEGAIFVNYIDSLFYDSQPNYDVVNGFSADFVSGSYNGYKIVKSVIDSNTFTISLAVSQMAIRPTYTTLINIENAFIKTNIQIYSSINANDQMIIDFINHNMAEDKETGVLFISKTETTSSSYGSQMTNDSISQGSPDDLIDENITFVCNFIFRVKRQDITNASDYVIGYDANKISDNFNRVLKSIANRWFFEDDISVSNAVNTSVAYKSYWNGGSSVSNVDSSISNNLFYKMTFNFKITIQQSTYNTFNINQIGIPFERIELNIDYKNEDNTSVVVA